LMFENAFIVPATVEVEGTPEVAKLHHPTEFPISIALMNAYELTAVASL
jgi:hypothetical protein